VAIVYAGHISWKGVGVSLSGVSIFDRGGAATASWTLSGGSASIEGLDLRWDHGDASFHARSSAGRFRETLLASPSGQVAFDCVVPDGAVTVTRGNRVLEGRGYAERLELTIPPWSLPIDTLRWGRFTGGEERIVWIEWKGAHPLSRVFRNGKRCEDASILDDSIEIPGAVTLQFGERRELRSGRLGKLRGAVAGLVAQLPGMADVHETKWLRSGRALRNGLTVASGWAIDEEVRLR
jgi:hypothetical protein